MGDNGRSSSSNGLYISLPYCEPEIEQVTWYVKYPVYFIHAQTMYYIFYIS